MKETEIERLRVPYEQDRKEGPGRGLAEAVSASLPAIHELHRAVQEDLDPRDGGIRWWRGDLDLMRNGFIGDHLAQAVWSVHYNFLVAGLHLLELEDWLDRESDAMSRSLRVDPNTRRPRIGRPRPKCAADELPEPLVDMHMAGFLTAVGSALDCLGASIVGVAALPVDIVKADIGKATRALRRVVEHGHPGANDQVEFRDMLKDLVGATGPRGWDQWVRDYRNMVVHRARRLEPSSVVPVSQIFDHRQRLIVKSRLVRHLLRDPTLTEAQAWHQTARAQRAPVLTEDARTTLNGIKSSAQAFINECATALLGLWRRRRQHPSLLVQPVEQWATLGDPEPGVFDGYAPGTALFQPGLFSASPDSVRRLQAAQVFDGQRERLDSPPGKDGA